MKRIAIVLLMALQFGCGIAQPTLIETPRKRLTANDYISEYAKDAVSDMKKTGVPASITLAQGMFESDYGNSPLAVEAKNHFGIKCHKEWNGDTYIQDDDEKNECFRKYNTVLESFDDHSEFLKTRDRYKFLFDLEVTDYKGWAHGLKKAGYATNPEYAYRLIKIIEENNLQRFDIEGEKFVAELNKRTNAITVDEKPNNISRFKIPATPLVDDIPFVITEKGDTWFKIAQENNIELSDIYKFNDVKPNTILRAGMVVYISSKHNRIRDKIHSAGEGETMWYISQVYGIKLRKLYKHNKMKPGMEPAVNQQIKLS